MHIRDNPTFLSPAIYLAGALTGAVCGWWLWPIIAAQLLHILDVVYRGFPVILYNFLAQTGIGLGAATGVAVVTLFCRWRRVPGWILLVCALVAFVWGAFWAWDCYQSGSRRLALAIIVAPMLWIAFLGWLGFRAIEREGRERRRDLWVSQTANRSDSVVSKK